MAEVRRYINTDSSAGGNGTTNLTSGVNRAYVSASSWESNEQTDLVTDTDNHYVTASAPSSVADTTAVNIDGWTTSASYDIVFEGDNNGVQLDTSAYHFSISFSASYTNVFQLRDSYLTVKGVQVHIASEGSGLQDCRGFLFTDGNAVECYLENSGAFNTTGTRFTSTGFKGIAANYNAEPFFVSNCTAQGWTIGIFTNYNTGAEADSARIYYCTAYDNGTGIQMDSNSARSRNNLGYANGTDFSVSGGWHDYNVSQDSSAPGTNSTGSITQTFVDTANEDFHLANDTGGASGAGTSLSSDTYYVVTTDVDGDTRHATAPDCGADEYVTAGGGATGKSNPLSGPFGGCLSGPIGI